MNGTIEGRRQLEVVNDLEPGSAQRAPACAAACNERQAPGGGCTGTGGDVAERRRARAILASISDDLERTHSTGHSYKLSLCTSLTTRAVPMS